MTTAFDRAERRLCERYDLQAEHRVLDLHDPTLRTRALVAGSGPPLLLVHGGGGFAAQWVPLMAALHGRQLIAVERPGCGGSGPFDYRGVDLRQHGVAFLASVLDALGLEEAPIAANSMGGLWSLWLTLDRPERVSSLALLGSPALLLDSGAPLPMRLMSVRGLNRLLFRLQPAGPASARRLVTQVFGTQAAKQLPPEFTDAVEQASRVPGAQVAFRTLLERVLRLRGGRVELRADELARVRQPVLFIWGEHDMFAGPDWGRRACELIPDARLEVLTGGHCPWTDHPQRCAQLLSAFLEPADASVHSPLTADEPVPGPFRSERNPNPG